jgi:hypothetical protein
VTLFSPSSNWGSRSADTCDGRGCSRSAMEAARDTPFHGRRRSRRDRRRRRQFTLHAEVESAATAVIAVAGQGDEGFLVAEQLTEKMGHLRLPDESSHCRGQLRSGERPSRRQQSWFCDGAPAQTRRREPCAASHPSAATSTVSTDGSVMLDATTSSRLSSSVAASSIHVTGCRTAHHAGSRVGAGWGSSTINAKVAGEGRL